jgi:hypothetical protein
MSNALTISELRQLLGVPRHRITYALDRYGPAPAFRVGTLRFWGRDSLPAIEESLKRTTENAGRKLQGAGK